MSNRAIDLRSRGWSNLVAARLMVQNSRSAITNRKRSQSGPTWSCDQSCSVVPSITHDRGQTSHVTGYATMRLVVPFVGRFQVWWYNRLRSVTTGCTTLKLVVQPVVIRWWFHITEACLWACVYCTDYRYGVDTTTKTHADIFFTLPETKSMKNPLNQIDKRSLNDTPRLLILKLDCPTYRVTYRANINICVLSQKAKIIHAGQNVYYCLAAQNAHTCRRFTPWFCQLVLWQSSWLACWPPASGSDWRFGRIGQSAGSRLWVCYQPRLEY